MQAILMLATPLMFLDLQHWHHKIIILYVDFYETKERASCMKPTVNKRIIHCTCT